MTPHHQDMAFEFIQHDGHSRTPHPHHVLVKDRSIRKLHGRDGEADVRILVNKPLTADDPLCPGRELRHRTQRYPIGSRIAPAAPTVEETNPALLSLPQEGRCALT